MTLTLKHCGFDVGEVVGEDLVVTADNVVDVGLVVVTAFDVACPAADVVDWTADVVALVVGPADEMLVAEEMTLVEVVWATEELAVVTPVAEDTILVEMFWEIEEVVVTPVLHVDPILQLQSLRWGSVVFEYEKE